MIDLIGGAAIEEVEEIEAKVVEKHSMYEIVYGQIADVVQRLQPVTVQDIVKSQFDPQEPGVSEGDRPSLLDAVDAVVVVVVVLVVVVLVVVINIIIANRVNKIADTMLIIIILCLFSTANST